MSKPLQRNTLHSEIHVWACNGADLPMDIPALWGVLSPEEQAKTRRLARPIDQERAIISRGVLRTLLASYLNTAPAELKFSQGPYGKPLLADTALDAPAFNLSHSGGLLLLAFGPPATQLGIDIEQHRPIPEWMDIAEQHFHPEEKKELLDQAPHRQLGDFFNCWTRKEAVVKALGIGVSMDLRSFRVPVRSDASECPVLLASEYAGRQCTLVPGLSPNPGFSAALAYCGAEHHLKLRHRRLGQVTP